MDNSIESVPPSFPRLSVRLTARSQMGPLRPLTLKLKLESGAKSSRSEIIHLIRDQFGGDAIRGFYSSGGSWFMNVKDKDMMERMLETGLVVGEEAGHRRTVYFDSVGEAVRSVVLSELDPDISDEIVVDVLKRFGIVHSHIPLKREFEDEVENGKRMVKLTLLEHIPQRIKIVREGAAKDEAEFCAGYPNQMTNLKLYTHSL